jgi:hypothetical protein
MIAQSNYNLLRWLLRRGSPLPIPNRVVKPACADGTAVMWESMSLPFFTEPLISLMRGFLFYNSFVFCRFFRIGVFQSVQNYPKPVQVYPKRHYNVFERVK